MTPPRYRFGTFVVSARQRVLSREGHPVPLIPRYFDLLLLLIRRRQDAVSKEAIFTEVWSDVVVSDGALSQAIRTLRRTLGDDVREPRFIRTVSRHGYQFVYPEVVEEADERQKPDTDPLPDGAAEIAVEPLVDRLLTATSTEEARDLAEQLHELGTADAMSRLAAKPHHAPAVAMMREARWSVPNAGEVPLLADREAPNAIVALVWLRVSDVKGAIARRWASAAGMTAIGGTIAGILGGLTLHAASTAVPLESAVALGTIGAAAGAVGGAGIGAGLVTAEVLARSKRTLALVLCGALAGAATAGVCALVLRALLAGLFGLHLEPSGGAVDGLVLGAAAGFAYGMTTRLHGGGLATPRGRQRITTAVVVGVCCAVAATGLALAGRNLMGGMVHEIAQSSRNAELVLAPLGSLVGEPDFGPITRAVLSAFEGGMFGLSLAWGLTHRPALDRH